MVHLARFAGLDDDAGAHAQALADQVVVHRRGGQQRRDRDAVLADLAVRQDQDGVVGQHRLGGFLADPGDGLFHPVGAFGRRAR